MKTPLKSISKALYLYLIIEITEGLEKNRKREEGRHQQPSSCQPIQTSNLEKIENEDFLCSDSIFICSREVVVFNEQDLTSEGAYW